MHGNMTGTRLIMIQRAGENGGVVMISDGQSPNENTFELYLFTFRVTKDNLRELDRALCTSSSIVQGAFHSMTMQTECMHMELVLRADIKQITTQLSNNMLVLSYRD